MPAYQLRLVEQREERQTLYQQRISEQIDDCTEIAKSNIRNHVEKFLIAQGLQDITEIDYPMRRAYEDYLKWEKLPYKDVSYLNVLDQIKHHAMRAELQTLAGRKKYSTMYADQLVYLTYYPDIEIAETFLRARDPKVLLWDFTIECPKNLKQQIFQILKYVISNYTEWERKEKLSALSSLYKFCIEKEIENLQVMTMKEEKGFEEYLSEEFAGRRKKRAFGIITLSRKILFLLSPEINWKANVWYLERFHFSKERVNPSNPVESISFKEITYLENQTILRKYMRYLLGITDLSLSTIQIKFLELRNFLIEFDAARKPIYQVDAIKIQKYLEAVRNQNTREKTSNGRIFIILQFYNFLLVKGYIKKIPFRHEYYLQKVITEHHDRCVRDEVYEEILSKLANFPERLRLMFLHLWCTGIRCSEVCTTVGGNYEEKDGDYWMKVYQVKMKTYKRIPIPEALYKLVRVYIQKYQIGSDEYLFKNKKGGAFYRDTFRWQMLKYCEENQIANGEYLFKSHDYRHNLATLYYDKGISIQAVRDYLGHEYEEMTRQYVDYMPKKLECASERYFQEESHSFAAELMKGETDG